MNNTEQAQKLRFALDDAYPLMECKKALMRAEGNLAKAAEDLMSGEWMMGKLITWNHDSLAEKARKLSEDIGRDTDYCMHLLKCCSGSIRLALLKHHGQPAIAA